MKNQLSLRRMGKWLFLVVVWILVSAFNLQKAFHIDDTFHLAAAQEIADHPFSPMSGNVFWGHGEQAMHAFNQPPLFFYLIAGWSAVFGDSEFSLHLLLSGFTFLCLFFFYESLRLINAKYSQMITLLFAFCPAFIVNQNLMVDIPLLAMVLACFYYLLKWQKKVGQQNVIKAVLFLSAGLLIKYTVLPLIVVLMIFFLMKKAYKQLIYLAIPIGILALWSLWNYVDYGGFHLFSRSGKSLSYHNNFLSFVACLGAISFLSLGLIGGFFNKVIGRILVYSAVGSFVIYVVVKYVEVSIYSTAIDTLSIVFLVNGVLILTLVLMLMIRLFFKDKMGFIHSDYFLPLLFFGSIGIFVSQFAPFMATRHLLLVFPFLLIMSIPLLEKLTLDLRITLVSFTIIVGSLIGTSDWMYADFYRNASQEIQLEEGSKVWYVGSWGWQWYASERGWQQYGTDMASVEIGDYFLSPLDIPVQPLDPRYEFEDLAVYQESNSFLNFFCVSRMASMYMSNNDKPAWVLSHQRMDRVYIRRLVNISETPIQNFNPLNPMLNH